MKYLSLILLSTISLTHCMQQEIVTIKTHKENDQEWDNEAYAKANTFQERVALQMIRDTGFVYKNERLLDVGCGTGNISYILAQTTILTQTAESVHGIDASEHMIEHAKKAYPESQYKNLSFEQRCAEKFVTNRPYSAAVTFNCLHWIKDKDGALKSINRALGMGGNVLGNVRTAPSPNLDLVIAKQLAFELIQQNMITVQDVAGLANTQHTDPTMEEFRNLLKKNGFYARSCKEKSFDLVLPNKEAVEELYRPIIMAHAMTKLLPKEQHEILFARFIELFIKGMNQDKRGYSTKMVTTVFHAMKINNVQ